MGASLLTGGLAALPAYAATSVIIDSVTQSPTSNAGATTGFTVNFTTSSTGALVNGDTITITFNAGTTFGSNIVSSAVYTAPTGNPAINNVVATQSGTVSNAVTFTVTANVGNSATLKAVVLGVINPSTPGSDNLSVTTTADTGAPTSGYTVTADTSVSQPSVTVSPTTATSALTGYSIAFATSSSGGMSGAVGSQVTVTFPSGFGESAISGYTELTDETTGEVVAGFPFASSTSLTFSISSGQVVHASDSLVATVQGETNPSTASGTPQISVSTTSDTVPASSPTSGAGSFTVTTANSVSNVKIENSGSTDAASGTTDYTVSFTTSATGGMSYPAGSTVTVTFPTGFSTNAVSCFDTFGCTNLITDTTTGAVVGYLSGSGTEVTGHVACCQGSSVKSGDSLSLVMDGVVNSSTPSTTDTVTVVTTSDNASSVTSNDFTIASANAAGTPTFSMSPTTVAGAVTSYVVKFVTNASTGGLSGADGASVTVNLPSGASYGFGGSSNLVDVTTGQELASSVFSYSAPAVTETLSSGALANPGDTLVMTIGDVTNPASCSGGCSVTVKTSSDSVSAASNTVSLAAASAPTAVSVALSGPSSATDALTGYRVTFTTSGANGGLTGTAGSHVTITFSAGFCPTGPPFCSESGTLTDSNTGATVASISGGAATVTGYLDPGQVVKAGDTLVATVNGIVDPTATGSYTATVSTTSDTTTSSAASVPTLTTGANVSSVSNAVSGPTTAAGGLTAYQIDFTTASNGGLSPTVGSWVDITPPTGFSENNATYSLFDTTSNTLVGGGTYTGGNVYLSQPVAGGDTVQVTLFGIVNGTAGPYAFSVSTSSEPASVAAASDVTVTAANPVSGTTAVSSGPTTAAGGLTAYTVTFITSATGALSPSVGSTITLTLPSGFNFGNGFDSGNYSVQDVTTGVIVATCSQFETPNFGSCSDSSGGPIPLQRPVTAGDTVAVTIEGIVNGPVSSTNQFTVTTSSDSTSAASANFSTVAAQKITTPAVTMAPSSAAGALTGWTATFTTSTTGALSGAVGSYVEWYVPNGTGTSRLCQSSISSTVFDETTGLQVANDIACPIGNEVLVYLLPDAVVNAGDVLVAGLPGVMNISKPGTYFLKMRTSSDPGQVPSSNFSIVPAHPLLDQAVSISNLAANALANYVVTFQTSSTGGLAGSVGSFINLVFPEGTAFSSASCTVTDTTRGENIPVSCSTSSSTELTIDLTNSGADIGAGDDVRIELDGVTNPAAGTYEMEMATSSDWNPKYIHNYTIS